ncbi:MAG: DUF4003 domain-containing protein [Oscillospiraceae bacterium]|jgi:hypothetical protein|nr:DUF4003 domain-containing protein [Oscillospiraceae bacterium]
MKTGHYVTPLTQEGIDRFAAAASELKRAFWWRDSLALRLAAFVYARAAAPPDCAALRRAFALIRGRAGVFSPFRGNMSPFLAALLSLPSPRRDTLADEALSKTLKLYSTMRGLGFRAGDRLVMAAFQLASQTPADRCEAVALRALSFYMSLKAPLSFLTCEDGCITAAALALSDADVAESVARVRELYEHLRRRLLSKQGAWLLAQLLAAGGSGGDSQSEAAHALALRDALRARRVDIDTPRALPMLAALAALPAAPSDVANEVAGACAALRERKGFSAACVAADELLLYASALAANGLARGAQNGLAATALCGGVIGAIAARQVMVMAICAVSATAAVTTSAPGRR